MIKKVEERRKKKKKIASVCLWVYTSEEFESFCSWIGHLNLIYKNKQWYKIVKTHTNVHGYLDIGYFFIEALNEWRDARWLMLSGKSSKIPDPGI